jgi:hypothetical protein
MKRLLAPIGIVAAALALSACGSPTPTYNGGGNGGGTTTTVAPTTATTVPITGPITGPITVPSEASQAAVLAVSRFVTLDWSLVSTWPNAAYATVLTRPYVTAALYAQNAANASRPLPAALVAKWRQDQRFKIGQTVTINAAFVDTNAPVTPTSRIVVVDFSIQQTTDGVLSGSSTSLKYAFIMNKVAGRWLVASQPQLPQ